MNAAYTKNISVAAHVISANLELKTQAKANVKCVHLLNYEWVHMMIFKGNRLKRILQLKMPTCPICLISCGLIMAMHFLTTRFLTFIRPWHYVTEKKGGTVCKMEKQKAKILKCFTVLMFCQCKVSGVGISILPLKSKPLITYKILSMMRNSCTSDSSHKHAKLQLFRLGTGIKRPLTCSARYIERA